MHHTDFLFALVLFNGYLMARVEVGKGRRINVETGEQARITISTLWHLGYDLFFLVRHM